jgi:hypothetical protein
MEKIHFSILPKQNTFTKAEKLENCGNLIMKKPDIFCVMYTQYMREGSRFALQGRKRTPFYYKCYMAHNIQEKSSYFREIGFTQGLRKKHIRKNTLVDFTKTLLQMQKNSEIAQKYWEKARW